MSQLGQHVQANENGQKAAAIAEIILIKTHEFCQMSIDELMARDAANVPNSKVKSSIIDHTVTDTQAFNLCLSNPCQMLAMSAQ